MGSFYMDGVKKREIDERKNDVFNTL